MYLVVLHHCIVLLIDIYVYVLYLWFFHSDVFLDYMPTVVVNGGALRHLTKTLTTVSWRRTDSVLRVRAASKKERIVNDRHGKRR